MLGSELNSECDGGRTVFEDLEWFESNFLAVVEVVSDHVVIEFVGFVGAAVSGGRVLRGRKT